MRQTEEMIEIILCPRTILTLQIMNRQLATKINELMMVLTGEWAENVLRYCQHKIITIIIIMCQVQPFTRRPYLYTPSPPYRPPILRAAQHSNLFQFFFVLSYTNGYPLPMTCRMTIPSSPTPFHENPKQCCLFTINRETLNRHCHGIMPPPQPPVCTSMPRHRQYGTVRN